MFFRRLNWNVVSWFKTVSMISYAVIFCGVVALVWHATHAPGGGFQPSHALRLGLSFTGGTDVTVKYQKPASVLAIQKALAEIGVSDANVNTIVKTTDAQPSERFTISTQIDFGDNTAKLWSALGTVDSIDRGQSQIESVGPSLGKEYLIKAGEALVIAISIQFVYIAFRFGWNYIFGLVVVIALVRDAAMMIGIYAIADKRADDAFLAAVLTVIGYSVMDTIVILDRIRENVKVMAGEPYAKIVNTSILQTMTRSFNTLATVVITLVALLAFGGASLQNFAFALLVGICSGGYHSIFYSAPLVDVLRERQLASAAKRREEQRNAPAEKPRTVAEARAQAAAAKSREAIVAARKERRQKEKAGSRRTSGGPVRYRRKRADGSAAEPLPEPAYDETNVAEHEDAFEPEYEQHPAEYHDPIDPLDAQEAGLHDQELALGHEEIHLNLDIDGQGDEHPAIVKHEQ
ncbi:MAG: protein translocase subunit SecF [Vulcanimicrobiaceae bacterium]